MNFLQAIQCAVQLLSNPAVQSCLENLNQDIQRLQANDDVVQD